MLLVYNHTGIKSNKNTINFLVSNLEI